MDYRAFAEKYNMAIEVCEKALKECSVREEEIGKCMSGSLLKKCVANEDDISKTLKSIKKELLGS